MILKIGYIDLKRSVININLLILVFFLFIMFLLSVHISNGDLMAPLPLTYASFLLVALVAFTYNGFQKMDISFYTIIFIISNLFVFSIGYILNYHFWGKKYNYVNNREIKAIHISNKVSIIILFIDVITLYLSFNNTLSQARLVNANANIFNMLEYARSALLFKDVSGSLIVNIFAFFSIATGYLYSYKLINNYIIKTKEKKIYIFFSIMIVFISLLTSTLSTGRTFLIKYITICVVMYMYLYKSKLNITKYSLNRILKNVKNFVIVLISFFCVFQLMGLTTGKTGKRTAVDMLYTYTGSSIIALDTSLKKYDSYQDNRFFGEESFYGLYGSLNAIGIKVPNNILHLPFVQVGENQTTNIYTSLRTYLYDYGYVGTYIVQFILGLIFGFMYFLLKKHGKNAIYLFIYGIGVYGIVMQGIEEIQLRNFMSITNIVTTIFFSLLYYLLVKKIKFRL